MSGVFDEGFDPVVFILLWIDKEMSSFKLPNNSDVYTSKIIQRSYDLINTGIWTGIKKTTLDSWINNFKDELEQYFAACVLDCLIYRSNDQTMALARHLFQRSLTDAIRKITPQPVFFRDLLQTLQQDNKEKIRLVIVEPLNATSQIKSSSVLLRMIRRELAIKSEWIIGSSKINEEIKRGVKLFVFIDDFLGTGVQFKKFADHLDINKLSKDATFIYAPLVAHESGIKLLKGSFPDLHLTSVEVLTENNELFSSSAGAFNDRTNTVANAKDFYHGLLNKYHIDLIGGDRRGYGGLEVLYAFEHAAPDNSLPIIWWDKSAWVPLFPR